MSLVKLTSVFRQTAKALTDAILGIGPRLIVEQGGQGSSKTYSILQAIYEALKEGPAMKTTFSSYALPHLKLGAIANFDDILETFGENVSRVKSSPMQPVYHIGKSEINCYGVEGNLAMAHGPRRKILFVNEANHKITYEVFDQLFSRSEITILDFNPDQEFWLHEKVLPHIPHVLIKSSYLDNPYLPYAELQNILLKKDKPEFENWWKVYGMGELGKLEGAIFKNWTYGAFDTSLPYSFGLDFGFNAPDAMVKMAVDEKRKKVYWQEKIYKSGNSTDDLKTLVGLHCKRNDLIIADSADARMISELKKYFNIKPTNKQKWTVPQALKIMQNYQHIITEDSPNLAKEFNNYIWSDKTAGIPIDAFNHEIDAGRYSFLESYSGGGAQVWHG